MKTEVNPFVYAKVKHQRTRHPPPYTNYRHYKPELKAEFAGQCVYCRAIDRIKGDDNFGVDHYRPQSRFQQLVATYWNLFYACNRCNRLKNKYWPTPRQLRASQFIPNPCDYVMWDHLRYSDGEMTAASFAGAFTSDRLDLNDPQAVELRRMLMLALRRIRVGLADTRRTIAACKQELEGAQTPERRANASARLAKAKKVLLRAKAAMRCILG